MKPFKHILVPVDFGEAMPSAIEMATSLAQQCEARVTLVNAFDITPFLVTTPFAPTCDLEPLIEASKYQLKATVEEVRRRWANTEALSVEGSPYEVILEVARAHKCDLIVIGTHGRRGMARALLGSVAERIVRLSPIPVLTVHPASRAKEEPTAA